MGRTWIDDAMIDALPTIGNGAAYVFAVFVILCRCADKDGNIHPKRTTLTALMKRTGFSRATLVQSLLTLEKTLEWIIVTKASGKPNTYQIKDVQPVCHTDRYQSATQTGTSLPHRPVGVCHTDRSYNNVESRIYGSGGGLRAGARTTTTDLIVREALANGEVTP